MSHVSAAAFVLASRRLGFRWLRLAAGWGGGRGAQVAFGARARGAGFKATRAGPIVRPAAPLGPLIPRLGRRRPAGLRARSCTSRPAGGGARLIGRRRLHLATGHWQLATGLRAAAVSATKCQRERVIDQPGKSRASHPKYLPATATATGGQVNSGGNK